MSEDGITLSYSGLERVPLLRHPDLDERWLLACIGERPEVLGLGDLLLDEARARSSAGRLELVLHDPDGNRQYDVALQVGATDDRYFLRAVEPWAAERKRIPRRGHCAVDVQGCCQAQQRSEGWFHLAPLQHADVRPVVATLPRIAEDPTMLGLGNLVLKDKERIQPRAGRLDLLLQDQDPETSHRYEVEVQLGSSDESHIIRAIEYWDIERKRYPQYKHSAVLIAEDITSRFLNIVIQRRNPADYHPDAGPAGSWGCDACLYHGDG